LRMMHHHRHCFGNCVCTITVPASRRGWETMAATAEQEAATTDAWFTSR